jgi:D-beta-D-heptose 7-phosphate kinase/D-beta-D-heptose 1-phosphate adenosyltransferase
VNSLEDRMEVLSALACVDWVIPFGDNTEENDTPEQLIKRVNPQVLAKGGDYSIDTIVGADFVQENGGEVAILPTVEGRSTTGLIKKVRG